MNRKKYTVLYKFKQQLNLEEIKTYSCRTFTINVSGDDQALMKVREAGKVFYTVCFFVGIKNISSILKARMYRHYVLTDEGAEMLSLMAADEAL